MAVYVDDMRASFGRMVMCHMVADTSEELEAMARVLGLACRWAQHAGTPREHYDVCQSKRAKAVAHGAVPITWRQTAMMCRRRADTGQLGSPDDAERWFHARGGMLAASEPAQPQP